MANKYEDIVISEHHHHLANKYEDIVNLQGAEAYCVATRTACLVKIVFSMHFLYHCATISVANKRFSMTIMS